VARVRAGTWKSESVWWGMDKGVVDIAPFGPMVPKAVRDKVLAAKAELLAGRDTVFAGPVTDQKGQVRCPAGQTIPDADLLGMTWFVKGVIGATE